MPLQHATRLEFSALEDRTTPASAAPGIFAVGTAEGLTGDVVVYSADRTELFRIPTPYGADFTGGVRVAVADVTGDGVADIITAPGPGTEPVVKIYDGATQKLVASFDAYEVDFTGGVTVAAADLNGDGKAEVITGADQGGGPRVRVFDVADATDDGEPKVLDDYLAIEDPNFRGGIRLATGDLNGDGVADLVVGAGEGGGPRIAGFDGASLGRGEQVKLFADLFAFEPGLRDGCNVGIGDVNGDGTGDLVFGGGPGGAPRIRVADGARLIALGGGGSLDSLPGVQLANFFAGDPTSRDGVRVGTTTTSDGSTQVVALDVASGSLATYSTDGSETGSLDTADSPAVGYFACSGSLDTPTAVGVRPGVSTEVATHFAVIAAPWAFAGSEVHLTVVALDANTRRVVGYTGTVTLTSTDTDATLPEAYTFTAAERGVHVFTMTPTATGSQTVTATDGAGLTGSFDLDVTTAPVATHFLVLPRPRAFVGVAAQVEVIALDASNRIVRNYTGTVHFTSTDTGATLPADYTFTADDAGIHVFTITPSKSGTQTLTVTDTASDTVLGTVDVNVKDAPVASQLGLLARPFAATGRVTRVTVAAVDSNGQLVPNYAGTVHFTSSDTDATLPTDYTFVAADHGIHTFAVTLATAGRQTITVTDGGSLTGTATVRVVAL